MSEPYVRIAQSPALSGTLRVEGAKNAVLPLMVSTVLASGVSVLTNVPASRDVTAMGELLTALGARVRFDALTHALTIDTSQVAGGTVPSEIMKRMRASVLVLGPLLARFGWARIALPGGDPIGTRPVDIHLQAFERMGATVAVAPDSVEVKADRLQACRIIFDYPSVGATQNVLMASVLTPGRTTIVNAAIEPEIGDLIDALRCMGARIGLEFPATLVIDGVSSLAPLTHAVMPDRLEAGTLLLAVAATGGSLAIPNAPAAHMELFLKKLSDMGHAVTIGEGQVGVYMEAAPRSAPIRIKTMPHPGFPTDLQAPLVAVLACATGTSTVTETVFENRMLHVPPLQQMGANIQVFGTTATIVGVERLVGASVVATDIRAAAALVIAGLVAEGETIMTGVSHLLRGYEGLDVKLRSLGAIIEIVQD